VTQADGGMEPAAMDPAAHAGTPVVTSSSVGVADVAHGVVRVRMSEYLADALVGDERQRIDKHVAACKDCAAYLATLRKTLELTAGLPARAAPRSAREEIMRRARELAARG